MQNQHLVTMIQLHRSLYELELVQDLIDMGRAIGYLSHNDQEMQLEMDRRQTTIDDKRKRILKTMTTIASWN